VLKFKAVALRWVSDEPQPGILEISVLDAFGQDHRILEKDIVTPSPLTKDAPFPVDIWIEVETQDTVDGYVKARLPWHMETTTGETELTLSRVSTCPRPLALEPGQNPSCTTMSPGHTAKRDVQLAVARFTARDSGHRSQ